MSNEQAKLLIVDDLEPNLIALEALLEDCNADIHRAGSGNEALSLILKYEYALVLLDVQMPGMDGFETAELMRLNAKTRHIPIIFITAISKEKQFIFKGYQSGAVDYLPKPIDPVILQSKVSIFLELWNNRQELALALAENRELSEKLQKQAHFDLLTGLPNRLLFKDRLHQAIFQSERTQKSGALMFIDLDRFKPINDQFGHDIGDRLLEQVAERLLSCVRKSDTVARIAGDEFTVILQNIENNYFVENIAVNILTALSQSFYLEDLQLNVTASIGVSIFPKDSSDFKTLMINADTAMYQAKAAGRNAFRLYHDEMKQPDDNP